ncbi:peptide chain release factor methyltransferase [Citrifermentans bemidjiense Bem]|uniref:Release factor glutamine methyltransferase n=1 Tax=Citrifermentans bemidjiense (strain ATCC BAA-1014 / DSM 16622 / JCM 12645 / Bem) TaxID=404380 RepID=B5EDS2_CITBB|nr:peptide chain release factor N(5)-glutamine methyltransferase [Citrifermentans bemidjiense]ACH40700.1 peptide chain release factor methyltransferase [Citrifermentans bemidjiense Bem]
MTANAEKWDVLKVLNWTKGYLAEKGVENPRLEAEWMLCEALSLDRVGLYLNFDKPLSDAELALYRGMVARRGRREPLQYILGSQEFMGLEFRVTPAVLIPRHDTEVLVTEAVKRGEACRSILDIGTGSGCVAVAVAKALPEAEVFTVDVSADAIEVARGNAERNGVTVQFFQGSLFEPFAGKRFDMLVSNPPYITSADLATLQQEVRDFEPAGALDGGGDGLDFYRRITADAPAYLNPGGWLLFEVGAGQAGEVLELLNSGGFSNERFSQTDPAGIERVVGGRLA